MFQSKAMRITAIAQNLLSDELINQFHNGGDDFPEEPDKLIGAAAEAITIVDGFFFGDDGIKFKLASVIFFLICNCLDFL